VPPKWVIKNLLPVGLTIIGGPPKEAKKSTLTLAMAALVAGYKCSVLPAEISEVALPGIVMAWSFEAAAGEIRHTMEKEMLIKTPDDGGFLIADAPEEYLLDDPEGSSQIMHWLDAKKPRVAIIDPLRNAHSLDEKESGELCRILIPLRRWAKENDSAVIVVHHTRKLDEERSYNMQDLRGSSALYGLADGILVISPTRTPMQFNYAATFKRGGGWDKCVQLAAYETKGQRAGEALTALDRQILKVIAEGHDTIQAIMDEAHLAKDNVRARLAWLQKNRYIRLDHGRWSTT
jgi:hypothetical protein